MVRRQRRDAGMVTAETAVVLPVLLLVLAAAVAAVTLVGSQLRCVDAAREGARAAARGEPHATVVGLARRAAPDGAVVGVLVVGQEVRVSVTADVRFLGPVRLGTPVTAEAVALLEPGVAETSG